MRKALFVFALVMLVSLPVVAEAQWGAPGPFVYPEPQIGYPYSGMPQVMYPAPPPVVMYPAPPQVIYAPPPQVMIQLQPVPPMPQPHRHHVLKSGGGTIVTKCSNCTVNNTINDGRAVVQQSSKPAVTSPSADSWLFVLLVAAVVLVMVLLGIVIIQRMTRPRPGPAAPVPAVPAPSVNVPTDAVRRPRPRVHRRKCEHPDCHHKIEICCHAEENGGGRETPAR